MLHAVSNSYAQPILRTDDLTEALRTIADLVGIAHKHWLVVDFDVRVDSDRVLASLRAVMPDAECWSIDEGLRSSGLPVWLRSWGLPPEVVEAVLTAAGDIPLTIRWDFSGWPAAPDIGLDSGGPRGAFVTLCSHTADLDLTEPASDYVVYVHVKQRAAARDPWLASRVGRQVIGDLVMAPG